VNSVLPWRLLGAIGGHGSLDGLSLSTEAFDSPNADWHTQASAAHAKLHPSIYTPDFVATPGTLEETPGNRETTDDPTQSLCTPSTIFAQGFTNQDHRLPPIANCRS
jgi:hypothetical protein